MLHVTNGDAAAGKIEKAGLGGEILPWRDILHEGPVPGGISEDELDEVRARFIHDRGWKPFDEVRSWFSARAVALSRAIEEGEIVLWFEHDLYDQLQLIQILSWFADRAGSADSLSMICIGTHPEVERFIGLGQLSPAQLATLFPTRIAVTPEQLDLARFAWSAFRSPDPRGIQELIRGDTSALPHLGAALRRHLEQYPSTLNGLARSEHEILEAACAGIRRLDAIFMATQDMEEAPFLGDTTVFSQVGDLCSGPRPLLRSADRAPIGSPDSAAERAREVDPTDDGQAVRKGRLDWIQLRGGIDRWLGGVHLTGTVPQWRWDREDELLEQSE